MANPKFTLSTSPTARDFFFRLHGKRLKPLHEMESPGFGIFVEGDDNRKSISCVDLPSMDLIAKRTDDYPGERTYNQALKYVVGELQWLQQHSLKNSCWDILLPEVFTQIIDAVCSSRIVTPSEIFFMRRSVGLTQLEAAQLLYVTCRTWQRWESGERRMSSRDWELFCHKINKTEWTNHIPETPGETIR